MRRTAVGAQNVTIFNPESKLRSEHSALAAAFESAPQQLLVDERPVHFGGIEKVDAEIEGAVDRRQRFPFIRGAVHRAHAHASETKRGNSQSAVAQKSALHMNL